MRLFTCKKYDFLIEKNHRSFPAASPHHPKLGWGRACSQKIVVIPTDLSLDSITCGALRKCDTLVSYSPKLSYDPAHVIYFVMKGKYPLFWKIYRRIEIRFQDFLVQMIVFYHKNCIFPNKNLKSEPFKRTFLVL